MKLCLTKTHLVRKKPAGSIPGPDSQAARPQAFSVEATLTISAQRGQIFVCVVTQAASRAHMVDLETIGNAEVLASPAVTFQYSQIHGAVVTTPSVSRANKQNGCK